MQVFGTRIKEVYKTLVRYQSTRAVDLANTAYLELYKVTWLHFLLAMH